MKLLMQQQWRVAQTRYPAPLKGWVRWVALLFLPFSVLAFDTWLGTETLKTDYEIAELNRCAKVLHEEREALKLQEANQTTQNRIAMEAPDLGLIEPQPGQIKIIYYAEADDAAFPVSTKQVQAATGAGSRVQAASVSPNTAEGTSWNIEKNTKQQIPMPLAARLHEVIANVYASCRGDS